MECDEAGEGEGAVDVAKRGCRDMGTGHDFGLPGVSGVNSADVGLKAKVNVGEAVAVVRAHSNVVVDVKGAGLRKDDSHRSTGWKADGCELEAGG